MEFEYDPQKSDSNAEKHGIDFEQAKELWDDARVLFVEARSSDETRFAIIALRDGKVWTCIFTMRDGKTRIISARRARNEEEERYYQS